MQSFQARIRKKKNQTDTFVLKIVLQNCHFVAELEFPHHIYFH